MSKKNKGQILSARQKEIISLVSDGYADEEIAKILKISANTVTSHRNAIRLRLNIQDIAGVNSQSYCEYTKVIANGENILKLLRIVGRYLKSW